MAIIDAILEADKKVHVEQRHTAVRIRERLRDEHGYRGGYILVREQVNDVASRQKEVCMPLAHRPGHAQVDFGEADGYIGGKTHTALALGLDAFQKGHSVAFTTAAALVHELMEARDEKRFRRKSLRQQVPSETTFEQIQNRAKYFIYICSPQPRLLARTL